MRWLAPPLALGVITFAPAIAEAGPLVRVSSEELVRLLAEPAADPAADPEGEVAPDPAAETPETAPEGEEAASDDMIGDPTAEGEGEEGEETEEADLEEEITGPKKKGDFNAHALGVNGGIHLAPSYFLSAALASYANSMCRNEIGNWGEKNGLVKVEGCNFYVNGGYTYRVNRNFDVNANVGYLHIKLPDAMWLDNGEWDRDTCTEHDDSPGSSCNLGAADYTQIDLRMVTIEVNFVGRGTLYRNKDVEVQLGGGGGVGVGILVGKGIFQTPLGIDPGSPDDPNSCRTLADLGDFRRCTPRYYDDPEVDQDGDGTVIMGPNGNIYPDISREDVDMGGELPTGESTSSGDSWVRCSRDQCDASDLDAIGRSSPAGQPWPAYPIVNLFGSFRIIIKDTFGITIDGGIKDGFFFGGGMQYFFGGGGKDREKDKAKLKTSAAASST